MITRHKLCTQDETPTIEQKKYRSMIERLQYLTHTSLDIENVVGIVARFQADPREAQYVKVKRIFKYLKGTPEFGLWYDRSNDFTFVPILMLIGQAVWMTERAPVVEPSFLEEDQFLS